jgi:hypothetical protein
MVYSILLSGVENYIIFKGCKTDSVDIEITPDSLEVTQNFICKSIAAPSSAHGLGANTVFAAASAATPLCGTDSSQLTWNAQTYDETSFKVTVAQNLEARRTVGQQQIQYLTSTNRDITFDFIVVGSSTLTFTNAYLTQYNYTLSAGASTTQEESYTGFARTLTVT